jgi:hypothetical protein
MAKYFNTTGPCFPRLHYMLPPKDRLIGASLDRYIRDELYWVLHAPRQTGKTTFLQSWMHEINAGTEAVACYVTLETCQEVTETERAMPVMVDAVRQWAEHFNLPVPERPQDVAPEASLSAVLHRWAELTAPRKLIVFFDEVDVVAGPAMISFLRQLRGGFAGRGIGTFPVSVALVGMRDLRDYLVSSKDGRLLNPGSPFNIKEDSVTIGNFSRVDIAALMGQYTADTGQAFSEQALDQIYAYTSGQPWLVNALAKECVLRIVPLATGDTVLPEHVEQAKGQLITSRATHIDSLSVRLREPRIRKIVQPILTGASDPTMAEGDDFTFCLDLGMVAFDEQGTPGIANAIYREVFARDLSYGMQVAVPFPDFRWQCEDGSLDMDALMDEFQQFWAWNSEVWEEKAEYTEAFPHLLLMAFLQRVINGGGTVDREYAAGRGRMDLLIRFGGSSNLVEIKLVHPRMGREATRNQGLAQIDGYADRTSPRTCHLVIFDRRPEQRSAPWEERLSRETCAGPSGRVVAVVWC